MIRMSKRVAAGLVLLAGAVQAATTTTTSTTATTTTTLLPHPFSPATRGCIRQARVDLRVCRKTAGTTCDSAYEKDYANCFATGAGVKCATKCETKQSTCLTAAPDTQKSCNTTCTKARRTSRRLCRSLSADGDLWSGQELGCITDADAALHLCLFTCAEAKLDCVNAFTLCIANCPNL